MVSDEGFFTFVQLVAFSFFQLKSFGLYPQIPPLFSVTAVSFPIWRGFLLFPGLIISRQGASKLFLFEDACFWNNRVLFIFGPLLFLAPAPF